jgi:hypothetical protein
MYSLQAVGLEPFLDASHLLLKPPLYQPAIEGPRAAASGEQLPRASRLRRGI